ncbi:MAG: hypothetical protein HY909_21800 [Deltaproteobacteria bacterium]|nr:hypothetical protein [Deltaproteobacteria bacterium]
MSLAPHGHEEDALGLVFARLFVAVRTLKVHGPEHPLTQQQAAALTEALGLAAPPFSLQFVEQAVFRDRALVVLSPANFVRCRWLAEALLAAGGNELVVERRPDVPTALAFLQRLEPGPARDTERALETPGLRLGKLDASLGVAAHEVDPELLAAVQLTRAIERAEALCLAPEAPWAWPQGVAVVRRVERAWVSPEAAERVLETAPGARHAARRGVTAAFRALACLRAVGAAPFVQRVLCHGALALCLQGLGTRGGVPLPEAAAALLPRLVASQDPTRGRSDPHRERVSALVHDLAEPSEGSPLAALAGLVTLLYDLERLRCPAGATFDLSWLDLLAEALRRCPSRVDPRWLRVLLQTQGALPPGARVRCDDGREGVLLASARADTRHRVLVDGLVVAPASAALILAGDGHGPS